MKYNCVRMTSNSLENYIVRFRLWSSIIRNKMNFYNARERSVIIPVRQCKLCFSFSLFLFLNNYIVYIH